MSSSSTSFDVIESSAALLSSFSPRTGTGASANYSSRLTQRRAAMLAAAADVERLNAATTLLPCSRLSSLLAAQPRLFAGDTIAASGRLVRDIDTLPTAAAARVRVLLLGHCPLESLSGISQFPALERLSLVGCTSLRDWNELRLLHACPNLTHVALSGSGLSDAPFYRARALVALGSQSRPLSSFDGVRTDATELAAARRALRVRDAALVGLVAGEWRAWGLALMTRSQAVAAELAARGNNNGSDGFIAPRRPDITLLTAEWDARLPRRAPSGEPQPTLIALLESDLEWKAAAFAGPSSDNNHANTPNTKPLMKNVKNTKENTSAAAAAPALALTIPPLPPALRADALRWASALAALAAVQASVLGELALLVNAAADATLAARERAAQRDPCGRVAAAIEDAEVEREARCERAAARAAQQTIQQHKATTQPRQSLLPPPPSAKLKVNNTNNNYATSTLHARAARRLRPRDTDDDTASEALLIEAVSRVAAQRGGLVNGGIISKALPPTVIVEPSVRDFDAEAEAMGRLVAAVSRRVGVGTFSTPTPMPTPTSYLPTPLPAPPSSAPLPPSSLLPPSRSTRAIPSPFLDAADAGDADAAAALSDARVAAELSTLGAPALRLLAAGLAAKLRRFASANARNAALAAERLTAADLEVYELSEKLFVAEARLERAEATAATALGAAEAARAAAAEATAATESEAAELRAQLSQLLARIKH